MTLMTEEYEAVFRLVAAIRSDMMEDRTFAKAKPNHYGGVNSLILPALSNKKNRIPILRTLTGIKALTSSKNLTAWTCVSIIKELIDEETDSWDTTDDAWAILQSAEKLVEAEPDFGKREARYKKWYEESVMCNMQEDYLF